MIYVHAGRTCLLNKNHQGMEGHSDEEESVWSKGEAKIGGMLFAGGHGDTFTQRHAREEDVRIEK